MKGTQRVPISIPPGVNKDDNALTSLQFSDADKTRFYRGFAQPIGGSLTISYSNQGIDLNGAIRSLYAFFDQDGREHLLIGTNTRLYDYYNSGLYNITPLQTTTIAIPNAISTTVISDTNNMQCDPAWNVGGQTIVRVGNISATDIARIRVGDLIQISGASGFGGILAAGINGGRIVYSIGTNYFEFVAFTNATSAATGGGAYTLGLRTMRVTTATAGMVEGDRIKITLSTAIGGIDALEINREWNVRNVNPAYFDIYAPISTYATSTVAGGGGAATVYQRQITAGNCTYKPANGYGGGLYGLGEYGLGKPFSSGYITPRIWSFDRYGLQVVCTPGDQGYIYEYDGDIDVAPTRISGSPVANFVFVSHNAVVAMGTTTSGGGVYTENLLRMSDVANSSQWTPAANNLSFEGQVYGAGRFIGRGFVRDTDLLFTENTVYILQYIDKPEIWLIKELSRSDGLMSPRSVASLSDAVFWMGNNDFYMYDGATYASIRNNTVKQWVYDNINWGKKYLCFAAPVLEYNEIWFFFPLGDTDECNAYVIYNMEEGHWTNGMMDRTAAEDPTNQVREQFMAYGTCSGIGTLYRQEVGFANIDGNTITPVEGRLETNYLDFPDGSMFLIDRVYPSTEMLGRQAGMDANTVLYKMQCVTKEYDASDIERTFPSTNNYFNISQNINKIDVRGNGRQRKYKFSFSEVYGVRLQKFYEEIKPLTRR